MRIRPATLADIAAIRQVAHDTWPHTYREILSAEQITYMLSRMYDVQTLQRQMQDEGHRFFLACDLQDEVVGFAGFQPDYQGQGGMAKLHKLYLLPSLQGQGVGKQLLQACVQGAQALGQTQLQLNVNRYNRAVAFYRHCGFEILREEVLDFGEGYVMDDFVLVLALEKVLS